MSNTDQLGALEYEQEATWCENVSTFAAHRIPLLAPIDVSGLTEEAVDPLRIVQQLQGGTTPIRGVRGGSFRTRTWLHGHGGITSGPVAIDPVETWWGLLFGNPSLSEANSCPTRSAASGTTAGVGSSLTNIVTAASATFARGSLCRIGTGGLAQDARGGGQFYPVNNHTGTNLLLRHETIGLVTNGDPVHSGVNFYLPETPANASVRSWRGRWVTPDQRYIVRGVHPLSFTFSGINGTELPVLETEWGVSHWDSTSTGAYPSAVAQNQYNPAPVQGGSFIVGDVGSTTRTAYDVRAFSVTCELGMFVHRGHTGKADRQSAVGARRMPSKWRFSFTVDAPTAAAANIWEQKYDAGTSIWFTNSLSVTGGSALGMHAQNAKIDRRPRQVSVNGINSVTVEGYLCAGSDTATELSQAAFVLCAA